MKQALVDIEDSRFYEHNGLDVQGTLRALVRNVAAGRCARAARRSPSSWSSRRCCRRRDRRGAGGRHRGERRPQAAGGAAGAGPGGDVLEGRDPHPVPEHRVLRPGRLRHPGRRPAVLQRERRRPHAAAGGHARRPGAEPGQRRPDHQPGERRRPPQPGAPADARPRAHHRPAARRDLRAAGRRRARAARRPTAASTPRIGGFFCDYVLRLPDRRRSASPRTQLENGGLTIQTTLRPDLQARRRPGGARHPAAGRPAGRDVHRGRAGHRPRAGDERQPAVRLRRDARRASRSTSTSRPARAPGPPTRCSSPRPRWSGASRRGTRSPPATRTSSRVYKDRRHEPALHRAERRAATRRRWTWPRRWSAPRTPTSSALEDQLGSVEGPVRMAQRMGMLFTPDRSPTRSSRRTAARSPSARRRPARWRWPAPTRRSPPTARSATPRRSPRSSTATGSRSTGDDGAAGRHRATTARPDAIPPAVANDAEPDPRRRRTALRSAPAPGPPSRATRSPARPAPARSRYSVAFVGYTPQYAASVMVLNPKQNQDVGGFGGGKRRTIWHDAMAPILDGQPTVPFPPAGTAQPRCGPPPPRRRPSAGRSATRTTATRRLAEDRRPTSARRRR